jgi:hypothetical protein
VPRGMELVGRRHLIRQNWPKLDKIGQSITRDDTILPNLETARMFLKIYRAE